MHIFAFPIYHNFYDFYQNSYNFITFYRNFIEFKYSSINQKTRDLLIVNQSLATGAGSTIFLVRENFEAINFKVFLLLNSVKSLFLSDILFENIKLLIIFIIKSNLNKNSRNQIHIWRNSWLNFVKFSIFLGVKAWNVLNLVAN